MIHNQTYLILLVLMTLCLLFVVVSAHKKQIRNPKVQRPFPMTYNHLNIRNYLAAKMTNLLFIPAW